jgi:hypothetical protein
MKRVHAFAVFIAMGLTPCWSQTQQTVPLEVKDKIVLALLQSNSSTADDPKGGHHESGFKWGKDTAGNVIVSMSIQGARCGKKCYEYFIPADPSVDEKFATIDGFVHVHPKGDVVESYVQPPSAEDIAFAAGTEGAINIVVGAASKKVYFFNGAGLIRAESLKDFMK